MPHTVVAPEADVLRHDAKKAWGAGPRKAYQEVTAELGRPPMAGVTVASMVPSLTAVNRRGVPVLPGLLYGDREGRVEPAAEGGPAARRHARCRRVPRLGAQRGPRRPGLLAMPGRGHPCAVGSPGHRHGGDGVARVPPHVGHVERAISSHRSGSTRRRCPWSSRWARPPGRCPGTDTIVTGGTIDALCDQIVAGASEPGDVLVIFGATLIAWAVTEQWLTVPGPGQLPPHDARAVSRRWTRAMPGPSSWTGPASSCAARRGRDPTVRSSPPGWAIPTASRCGCPTSGGNAPRSRTTRLRSNIYGLDIGSGAEAIERAAFEASGFVVQRMLDMADVKGKRIVASGGGSRVTAWMAAVADATGLTVETVAVPEGAARGAAYFARMAAGLETSLEGSAQLGGHGPPDRARPGLGPGHGRALRPLP